MHAKGDTQLVGPLKPFPPHCAYCAAPPVAGGVDAGGFGVEAGGKVDVAGGGFEVAGGGLLGFEEPLQEKTGGPGIL